MNEHCSMHIQKENSVTLKKMQVISGQQAIKIKMIKCEREVETKDQVGGIYEIV